MSFHVGQKVVCVNTEGIRGSVQDLIEGKVYVIREVGISYGGGEGVKLDGHEHSCHEWQTGFLSRKCFKDAFLRASRFRPIVERKTDISVFTAMLDGVKQGERA